MEFKVPKAPTIGKIPWPYLIRLSAFFVVSLVAAMYLVFAPMVNRDFYNVRVLFKPVPCGEVKHVWFGREAQEIQFSTKSGKRLCGLYLPSAKAKQVILVHHGQFGNLNEHLPACAVLLQPENSVFVYDYEGFGKSEGSPTIAGMIDDARAAYDCVVDKLGVDPGKIVNYGVSLGSGPAALVSAEKPCAGLILVSPYTSLKASAKEVFPFLKIYPDFLLTDSDFDTIGNVRHLQVPMLIVHGADDTCIAVHHGDQIYKAAHQPCSYARIEGAGHAVIGLEAVNTRILSFIQGLGN
jgi:pimeloyl-ACP methyl ester carboxylesterase